MRGAWFATTLLVVAVAVSTAGAAGASATPSADLVLLWAPGQAEVLTSAIAAARQAGAAALDVTPEVAPQLADQQALRNGRAAYEALRFEEARTSLTVAAQSVEATGAAGLTGAELSDVFLYRGLAEIQLDSAESAWDDFVRAATVDPSRALDPAQFPPRAVEQFERARVYVAALPMVNVQLDTLPSCQVAIDGRVVAQLDVALPRGRHWLVASCPGHLPGQRGFDVTEALAVRARGAAIAPVSDDAALIQARSMGARAVLVVTVTGELALLRRLAIDGREQARRAVQVGAADGSRGAPGASGARVLAEAVTLLLREARPPARWYQSRWTWATAGVVAATAVLLPFVLRGDQAPQVVLRPQGVPW